MSFGSTRSRARPHFEANRVACSVPQARSIGLLSIAAFTFVVQGRYIAFYARHPGQQVPRTAIEAAMWRAIERVRRNPNHPMHRQLATPARGAVRAFNPAKPKE
jgi:hypothetical protein